jgi:glycosyltransferase involved in cell wall biosynthesis
MLDKLFLSVAVITYNQEKFISQTLDSILSQEHNYSYEIVIGDDCSTDNTKLIIEDYATRYPNIIKTIYNEINVGLIKNYFNVISKCSGKYIMECAGDDWWLPGKVKQQLNFMEANSDTGLCYGLAQCYNEDNEYINKNIGVECNSFEEVMVSNPIPAVTVCFKRECVVRYIDDVAPVLQGWKMEDYPMWLWFYKNSKVAYIPVCFACYRCLNESVSNSKNIEKRIEFLKSTYDIRNFYSRKYSCPVRKFESDETVKKLMFCLLLKSYDSGMAKKLRTELLRTHSFIELIKVVILSNKLLVKIVNLFYFKYLVKGKLF